MAKQITLEEIKALDHDKLAGMLYGMLDSNNNLYAKLEKMILSSNPQEVILLYRDACEKALATSTSKFYSGAIKHLKECIKLEKENDTFSWYIEENTRYLETLINTHKRKPKFVDLFFKAFG